MLGPASAGLAPRLSGAVMELSLRRRSSVQGRGSVGELRDRRLGLSGFGIGARLAGARISDSRVREVSIRMPGPIVLVSVMLMHVAALGAGGLGADDLVDHRGVVLEQRLLGEADLADREVDDRLAVGPVLDLARLGLA